MKRKFLSTLLFGALACTTLSTVTSCKDYDDDINSLQSQIDALSKKIDDINTQITNGAILTSVTPTANGLTIALSNGKTYDITNGNDGKDGTAWTISEDGFWVKDGTKTTYKAVPADGKDGKDGAEGKPGADGKDGKDGKYYVPNATTGNFDVVEDGKTTDSGISWKLSAVTGVMDNNVLTLYGIPNKEGAVDPNGVVINLNARLRGLEFAGDACVDGKYSTTYAKDAAGLPILRVGSFYFNSEKLKDADSENESSTDAKGEDQKIYNYVNNQAQNTDSLSYKTYAYYHVSPSNVNVDDLKKLSFNLQADNKVLDTRAASKNLTAGAEFVSYDSENGVVKVLVKSNGIPATGSDVSVVKLQSTLDDNATVTSSPAALTHDNIETLRLAKKLRNADGSIKEFHLRRASKGISNLDTEAGISGEKAWTTGNATTSPDLELAIGETLDLNNIVEVHEKDNNKCSVFDMARLGLSVSYNLVKNYKLGDQTKTDQADFIKLDGSKITPKVYDEQGNAAIGRTPIIRAALKAENGAVVEYAYIKVKIVEEKQADKAFTITPDKGVFKYDCSAVTLTTTVKQMNVELYNKAGLSYDEFYKTYPASKTKLNPTGDDYKTNVGTVDDVEETINGVPTRLLEWTLQPEELWANAGKEIQHVVLYQQKDEKYTLKLTLKATVSADGVIKEKNYTSADLINEYWKNGKAQFNVRVPAQDEVDKTKCTFVNNLTAPFNNTNGKLELSKNAKYSYYFCKDNNGETTIGGVKTKLAVSDDGFTLTAQLWNAQANKYDEAKNILVINNAVNDVANKVYNTVTVQDNEVAKALLNTGALEAKIGVKANACFVSTTDVKNDIKVTFNGEDHFTALFLRPLNVASKSATNFIDGVNFGNKGSWIKMKDLVNPTDWRGYAFTGTNAFLWKYYGVTDVTAVGEAECDLNGTRQALPATIKLEKSTADDTFWDGVSYKKNADGTDMIVDGEKVKKYEKDELGFLTYKNNSVTVNKAFNIFVKVKVTYKWGVVESGFVTIPVEPTVGQ